MLARWRRAASVLLFASVAVVPVRVASTCSKVDSLRLQLSWVKSPEFAGFEVPNSGFAGIPAYSEECLSVQVREGGPQFDPLQELNDLRADVALVEGAYAAQKIANGEDLTIIASFYQLSSLALVGLQPSYSSLQDLVFKRIGVRKQGYDLPVRLMFAKASISESSLTLVDQRSTSLRDLSDGAADMVTATLYRDLGEALQWLNPKTSFLRQQQEMAVFSTANYSAPALHNVLVVKSGFLPAMKAKLVRFLKVVARAWVYCRDNEASCMKMWPDPSPLQWRLMRETLRLIFPSSNFGVLSAATWAAVNDPLVTAGLIPSRTYSPIDNSLILASVQAVDASQLLLGGTSLSASAAASYSPGVINLCAPYGSQAPLRICTGQEHRLCSAGYVPPAAAGGNCTPCTPGRFAANAWTVGKSRMNACVGCPAGRFATASGSSECKLCATGRFRSPNAADYSHNHSNVTSSQLTAYLAATSCAQCVPGRSASSAGMTACDLCALGTYAPAASSKNCTSCSDGSYATLTGMTQCATCPDNTTTRGHGAMYVYECSCSAGFYRVSETGLCVACPEGFTCPVGSDETVLRSFATGYVSGQYPHLLPGYWASRADPLSVYLCRDLDSCPGGAPQSCGPHMEDTACGLCQRGYFRQGRTCESCTGTDESEFNYPALQTAFGPFIILLLYNTMWDQAEKWGNWLNELFSLAFLVVVHYQILGLVVGTSVHWPEEIRGTLYVWKYFVDIPDMLRLSCVQDGQLYRGFKDSYLVKVTSPLLLIACFAVVYFIGYALAGLGVVVRMSKQRWLDDMFKCMGMTRFTGKVQPRFAVDPNVLFNCYMAVFYAFFTAVCFISLQLFFCDENPNGKRTLRFGPDVECGSAEWQQILGEGILMLIPCVGFFVAGVIFVSIVAPMHFNDKGFRTRWKFLLIKFRPDVWWWGPVVMIRALLLCLTHSISQEGWRQLLWQLAVLLTYSGVAAVLRPWRKWSSNVLDLEIMGSLILFVAVGCSFVTHSGWLDDSVTTFACVFSFTAALAFLCTATWIAACGLAGKYFPWPFNLGSWNRQLSEDAQAAFAKFVGLDKKAAEAFVTKLSGQDVMALRRVCFVLSVELLGDPGKSRHFQWMTKQKKDDSGNLYPGPRAALEEDDAVMFDTGDITSEGNVEPSKWGMSPPRTTPSTPASRGGKDACDKDVSDKETGRTAATGATARTDTTAAASSQPSGSGSEAKGVAGGGQQIRQVNV